jgi:hypothetical protein
MKISECIEQLLFVEAARKENGELFALEFYNLI